MAPRLDPSFLTTPITHRGLHDASRGVIENSLSAFEAAIALDYGIELDVQMSADGEAMSFHDDTLDRLTQQAGPVKHVSAETLRTIPLTGSKDTIPDMRQTLDLIAGRVPLLIEIKDQDGALGPNVGPLEQRLADLLSGYEGPVAVMSFNPHSVAAFAKAAPHIARGRTTCDFMEWPGVTQSALENLRPVSSKDAGGISFISHDRADLESAHVGRAQADNLDILCWTIKSLEQEIAARKVAQNITFEQYHAAHPTAN